MTAHMITRVVAVLLLVSLTGCASVQGASVVQSPSPVMVKAVLTCNPIAQAFDVALASVGWWVPGAEWWWGDWSFPFTDACVTAIQERIAEGDKR